MAEFVDISGQEFGRLFTVGYAGTMRSKSGRSLGPSYVCICSCGKQLIVRGASLLNGNSKSCGCMRTETLKRMGKESIQKILANPKWRGHHVHDGRRTELYSHWCAMKARCNNKNSANWHSYGGRGIKVCDEWQTFPAFRDWAMANGYKDGLTIDRIDNDKGYEPSNCRWVTMKQQSRNTSRNLYFTIDGVRKSFSEWCEEYNVPSRAIYQRLKRGWEIEEALEIPLRITKRSKNYGI